MSLTSYSFTLSVGCPGTPVTVSLDGYAGPGPNEFNVRAIANALVPANISITSWDYQINDSGIWVNQSVIIEMTSGTNEGSYTSINAGETVTSVQFRIIVGSPATSGFTAIVYV